MHRRYITYFTWLNDELITVPNFPAWVCDVCGRREYDAHALSRLSLLLNPNAGKPASKQKKSHPRSYPKNNRPLTD
jgi:YgiT-type zinc finger domain-containing protein